MHMYCTYLCCSDFHVCMMYSLLSKKTKAHDDSLWACSWGYNSETSTQYIVTGGLDNYVKIWHWDEGEGQLVQKFELEGHELGVISADINNDGTLAVTSSSDSQARVWELSSGTCNALYQPDSGPLDLWQVRFSPDGTNFVTGTHSGNIYIHSTEDASRINTLSTSGKFILSVAYSPDGKMLAGASQEGIVYLFDLETSTLKHTLEAHAMPIRALAFSADSQFLLTGSDDKCIKVHDCVCSMPVVCTLPGHESWLLDVCASPIDSKRIASGSADNTVKIWDIGERKAVHKFEHHTDQVWSVSFSPNGSRLVSVSEDKAVAVYNIVV